MGVNVKTLNLLAMTVGYVVLAFWLAGSIGVGDFYMRYGQANHDQTKHYTCQSGDSFWTRKKYACDFREWVDQQAQKEAS